MTEKTFAEAVEWVTERLPGIAEPPIAEEVAEGLAVGWLHSPDFCRVTDIQTSERDKYMWDALQLVAVKYLRDRVALPDVLAEWVADVLEGRRPRPRGGSLLEARDRMIRLAINAVAWKFKIHPTREHASARCCAEGGSACDVVGAAAFPRQTAYARTEKIWQNRDEVLQSVFQLGISWIEHPRPPLRNIRLERLG